MKKKTGRTRRILKALLMVAGCVFITLCILAFTTLPFWAYYSLGTKNSEINGPPKTIVLLSGMGMPSADGLLRSYYTAKLAEANPGALVVIVIPGSLADSAGDPLRFAAELVLRGVNKQSITFENEGRNTREQALKVAGKIPSQLNQPLTLVTSPEHMRRSVLAFRKCGFTNVSGFPAFENALVADLTFPEGDLKGNKYVPPIGNNLQVRYQFWTHLKFEVIVIREYFALGYYKLRGWI